MTDMAARASSLTWMFKDVRVRRWIKTYGIGVAMGVFLTFVDAMQTDGVGVFQRLFYWIFTMLMGTLIAQICAKFLDSFSALSLWQEMVIMYIMITLLITVFVWAFTAFYFDHDYRLENLSLFLIPVAVIALAMTGLHFLADQIPHQSHVITSEPATAARDIKLRSRLEPRFTNAKILAVSSEDHYLRVYTDAGEALILMRLYDAIEELEGIEGSQVHRSWWVAKDAIADTIRQDGRPAFRLYNDQTVPISRTFIKALRAEGWL